VKIQGFQCVHMETLKKTNYLKNWALPCEVKIWPQISPAAYIFIRLLLNYAAKESASWELWCCESGISMYLETGSENNKSIT
jgi:hypothetical protein